MQGNGIDTSILPVSCICLVHHKVTEASVQRLAATCTSSIQQLVLHFDAQRIWDYLRASVTMWLRHCTACLALQGSLKSARESA